jgi:hydroxyethylthiazole kinase
LQGVDSVHSSTDALEAAKELARAAQTIVAVSGAVDLVTDGRRVLGVSNGVALMQRITATGCAVTALIAAFISVNPTRVVESTAIALSLFGLAGELGMEKADGPASLRVNLIDCLHMLDEQQVMSRVRIAQL